MKSRAVPARPFRPQGPNTQRALAAAGHWAEARNAAADLFRRHGFAPVTMRMIAAAAGCSTGLLFAHAKDKPDVWRQAMGRPDPDAATRTFLAACAVGALDPAELRQRAAQLLADITGEGGR